MPSDALERIANALDRSEAAVWDKHYGGGLSAPYSRAVSAVIKDAKAAVAELRAAREELRAHIMSDEFLGKRLENDQLRAQLRESLEALSILFASCSTTHPDWGADICEPDGNAMSNACGVLAKYPEVKP